jgi:hypothetical protein
MKLNQIAFAALAVVSAGAFAATTPLCTTAPTTGAALLAQCSPEVTFFAAGGTAMRDAYKNVAYTFFDNTKPLVYVKTLKSDSSENKDIFAIYGYGATTANATVAGKRLAVIVNTVNGSMAGVNLLVSGGKTGSLVNAVNGNEFNNTVQLQTAANQKAAVAYAPAGMTLSVDAATGYALPNGTKLQMATLPLNVGVADFKLGWGGDKNNLINIVFSDVRPTEAIPGQLAGGKWDTAKFPWTTLAMQGFQVAVNNKMYAALIARDVAAGRIASACAAPTAALVVADMACQPTITSAEMATIMNGKRPSSLGIVSDGTGATKITLQRRVDSSGTQSATQIFFTHVSDALGSKTQAFASVLGATLSDGQTVGGSASANILIKVNGSSDSVAANVPADTTGYSIGVVSNDKGSYNASTNIKSVKIDGFSPNFDGTAIDASAKATLAKGYPFQFEFGALAPSVQAAPQAAVASMFKAGLTNKDNAVKGVLYPSQTGFSRNGNNLGALTE